MLFFKVRTKLKETLPADLASNGQYALEHVLEAIARVNSSVLVVQRSSQENKVLIETNLAELITLWRWGYELKDQDGRTHAMIAKLLNIQS